MEFHPKEHKGRCYGAKQEFECDACKTKSFKSEKELKIHQDNHHADDMRFQCDFCDQKFKFKAGFLNHQIHHKNPKVLKGGNYTCDICGKPYRSASDKKKHIRSSHMDANNNFVCDVCNKTFSYNFNLVRHKKSQHEESWNLVQREKIQHEQLQCEVAQEESFHLNANEEFVCDICNQTFSKKGNLTRHKKSRHEEIVHSDASEEFGCECDVCHETFTLKRNLLRHKKVKHEHAQLHCGICNASFVRKSHLDKHKQLVHAE